ncbi:MAG: hypothetical protein KAU02_01470 [Tenericutes bacterium]|nr:hypothetical protein [Mycoplasmatota bacterium]
MKKLILTLLCTFTLFAMTGCDLFEPEEKEFSEAGMTITLNEDFILTETVMAPLYLVSLDHIFIGLRESKDLVVSAGINNLQEYADTVLTIGGHPDETTYNSEGDFTYIYAYYTASVDDIDYGYMLVCAEGDSYYYTMNFACLEDNLENNKELYIGWADSIIIV